MSCEWLCEVSGYFVLTEIAQLGRRWHVTALLDDAGLHVTSL